MELRFTFWPLFLLFVSDAIAAVSTVSTNDCLPRCCAQGQIIDRTATRCLINRSQGSSSDPCGRRDSFLPICQEQEGVHPEPESHDYREMIKGLKHIKVLKGMSKYTIADIDGEIIEAFYDTKEDIIKTNGSTNITKTSDSSLKIPEIPSSFCVDLDNLKILMCPRVALARKTTVNKCCPFGQQIDPLFSDCEKGNIDTMKWGLPIQGRRLPLANLIKAFPQEIRYDRSLPFISEQPCGPNGKLLFDVEAFQVDTKGELVFSRALGNQRIPSKDFCVDLVRGNLMVALFCQPHNVTEVNMRTQRIALPNKSTVITLPDAHHRLNLLCLLLFIMAVNKIWL